MEERIHAGERTVNTRKSAYFILPLIALLMMACSLGNISLSRTIVEGSGKTASEERSVSDVERVSLTDVGDLEIIQGNEEGLTVEADDNVLRYIETRMRGHELIIGIQNGIQLQTSTPIHYTLRVKSLSQISVSGSGNITCEALETGDLSIQISGSGNVNITQLSAKDLRVGISGSGNFDLAGQTETQDISISGSGNYTAGDLASQSADIHVSGSGDLTVWTKESLKISVSGRGTVKYYGQPAVTQSITGSGEVKSLGEH
jgi:hypothetical protein